MGVGIQQFIVRIGTIIGPVIFGFILDHTCTMWNYDPNNPLINKNCNQYNNLKMRFNVFYI